MIKAPKITKNCKICNKEFTVLLSKTRSYVNCSKECSSLHKSQLKEISLGDIRKCKICKKKLSLDHFKKHQSYTLKSGEIKQCYYNTCKECKSIKKYGRSFTQEEKERNELFEIKKRRCNKCKEIRDIEQYTKNNNNPQGLHYSCKICENDPMNSKSKRSNAIKRKYNLKVEEYFKLHAAQNGKCAICEEEISNLVVDHCHTTGVVRGLLCTTCNTGLGLFRDKTHILNKAINYLENAKALQAI